MITSTLKRIGTAALVIVVAPLALTVVVVLILGGWEVETINRFFEKRR